ncbi:MAG TPA: TonB-dependent receptor [Pseudomonadales bacterium]
MKKHRSLRKKQLGLVVSAISALLAGTVDTAFAQDEELEEITVTGSRIVRRDLSSPSPILTVGTQDFENSSTTGVESVLNQLPQFVPGGTQFNSSIQNSATSTPGAATLNLRGLGSNRNLVLIDGRRAQPANATLAVDVNTIPAAAIQSVEVITGGASAVYGPDAMAGVVNFILKDDFEGIEMDFQTGQTMEGDGADTRFSTLVGVNSGDGRGNVMIGFDWTKREAVFAKERDFYRDGWADPNNNSAGFMVPRSYFPAPGRLPSQAALDALFPPTIAANGTVTNRVSPTTEIRFNEDGTPFVDAGGRGYNGPLNCWDSDVCGPYTGIKKVANGNLQQVFTDGFISTPLERHSVFMRGNYDLNDNLNAFVQANYSNVEVIQRGGLPPAITVWQAGNVPRDGRTLPPALNALLDSRPDPTAPWSLFQVLDYNGPIEPINTNNVWQIMLGLEGSLREGDWTWDLHASRGDTRIIAENFRNPSWQRYNDMINAPNFGQGRVTRPDGGSGYVINCPTGLPVFKDFEPAASCLDGLDTQLINRSHLTQEIIEFNLQGGLFTLPFTAGETRFAAGASRRANSFRFSPGNPLGQIRDNPIGVFASNGTGGAISVREVYGELLIPVLDPLTLELGYRYSDFNTAGGTDTYKALFTWEAADWITVRGGYQFATRAPNIAELFTAPTSEVVPYPDQDPCAVTTLVPWGNVPGNANRTQVQNLCRAIIGNNTSGFDTQTYSITGISGPSGFHRQNPAFFPLEIAIRQGNPNVGPEEGETYTFGAVISEPFGVESLVVTADVYRIELTEAINPLNVATVYQNCMDGVTNPTYDVNNSWCRMIRRHAVTGDRAEVDTPFFNLGTLRTQGLDLNVNWSVDLGPGVFNVNSTINYLDEFEYQLAPGDRVVDAKGTLDQGGLFDWQLFTNFGYTWSNFNVGLTWRHLPDVDPAAASLNPNTTIRGPGDYDMFNASAGFNWNNYTFRFGIDNLLDADPELTQTNPGVDTDSDITNPGLYDLLGRRYYMGVKVSF